MRRGQAELIGGLIVLTLILLILIPLLLQVLLDYRRLVEEQSRVVMGQSERLAEKILVSWLSPLDPRYPAFWVNNTGTIRVSIKMIYVVDVVSNRLIYALNLSEYEPGMGRPITSIVVYPAGVSLSRSQLTLNPGESALVTVDPRVIVNYRRIAVALLSDRGVIHPVQGRGASVEDVVLKAIAIEQRIVLLGDILNSPNVQLRDPNALNNENPTSGIRGYSATGNAVSGYYGYRLCSNCNVIGSTIYFSNAIIGLKPGSSDKLNILLTYVDGSGVNYRVKVEGFKPLDGFKFKYRTADGYFNIYVDHSNYTRALGHWYYGRIVASEAWIRLVGVADNVKVYKQDSSLSMSSYDPYVFVADTDGNGVGEFIFTTEDYNYGTYNPPDVQCFIDEGGQRDGRSNRGLYLDHSVVKVNNVIVDDREWGFAFMLKDVSLDPSMFSGVMVVLKVYFHDTEGGDFNCVDWAQLPILKVMLVKDDWTVVDSKSFLYWELAPLEDTWHPTRGTVTLTLSLFIPPNVRERVYLAIAVIDPYNGSNGRNDVDFTLAIELLGISTYGR